MLNNQRVILLIHIIYTYQVRPPQMIAKLTHIIWLTRVYGGYDCSYWNYKLAYIVEPHPVIWMHKNWCNEI
jgi:hypothetical protein